MYSRRLRPAVILAGMRIACLSDMHGETRLLGLAARDLAAADVVILAGDITHFGDGPAASRILAAVREHNPLVLAVTGNCDFPVVEEYLSSEGVNLHRRRRVLAGVTFLGLGGSLPCPARTPNEHTEEQLAEFLETAARGLDPDSPLVLVSHQPPADTTADLAQGRNHVGSLSVRAAIERLKPAVCLSGHIHEARGVDAIGETRIVNPGPFGFGQGGYALIDLADGRAEVQIKQAGHE